MHYYVINGMFYDMTDNGNIELVAREFTYVHNIKVKSIKRISRKEYLNALSRMPYVYDYFVALD